MAPVTHWWKTPVHQDQVLLCRLVFLLLFGQAEPVQDGREEIVNYPEGILKVALLLKQALV